MRKKSGSNSHDQRTFLPYFYGSFAGFIFHFQDTTGDDEKNDCIRQNVTLPNVRNRTSQRD
jgi:hypothetical protein